MGGREDRARGAFLGLAVGDALGAPVEGMPAWEIRKRFGRVTTVLDPFEVWSRRPERGRMRGLHTDDTQQAWILAAVLLARGDVVGADVARAYVSFARPRPGLPRGIHRGTGRAFREAVARLAAGGDAAGGAAQPSAGNGAAMRVAPVGIVLAGDADRVVRGALASGSMTHADPRALEAAAALAALVAALLSPHPPAGRPECLASAIEGARRAEQMLAAGTPVRLPAQRAAWQGGFRTVLEGVLALGDAAPDDTLREVARLASSQGPDRPVKRGTEGFSPASVAAAIALGAGARDFRSALEDVVAGGEDTDTTGAMAGAIAGARFGMAAIPPEWIGALVARGPLAQVADALAGGGGVPPPEQEPLEELWTRAERDEAAGRARARAPEAGTVEDGPSRPDDGEPDEPR
jgi:ADP-ribosylglycohydrolase